MKLSLEIVVVFNEPDTLERVFLQSAGLDDATLVLIDNRETSTGLPTLFNAHKQRSTADWLVFCHQDFVVFDPDWLHRIVALPPSACYGPIGRDATLSWLGQLRQTDGSLLGEPAPQAEVVGVDEVCLVVPRDVYTRVDFDEGFPFDLYVHDYCLNARRLGYPTRIVQLACQHRSKTLTGNVSSPRYLAAKARFIEKHADVAPLVTSTFVMPRPPLIVAGMHRSGTSFVASLLSALSVDMGRQLVAPDAHNVRGYFEDLEFPKLQGRMLSESCVPDDGGHLDWGWTEHETLDRDRLRHFVPEAQALLAARSDRTTPWGWKDPRTSLLLDFWDPLLNEARYLFVYRFPWDVADSMQRLGAPVFLDNPEYAYRIWEYYNRHVRDFYAAHRDRCLLVSSNALPRNLQAFTQAVRDKLGVQIREGGLDDLYDEGLLRTTAHTDPLIDLVAAVWPRCARLLSELDELADISGAGSWQARPVRSRLARPDADDGAPIDVSVVTPCYEQGPLLVEAIASAERAAPPNCELIIVNDGSRQPRTLEIFDTLKGLGYYIRDQANLGLAAARNAAIALARGRYIVPLDDDNRLRADFLQDAIHVLDAHPDVGVVYGDRDDFGLRNGTQHIPEFDAPKLIDWNYIDACAVFRRQIWVEAGGYDESLTQLEDYELWIQAVKQGWKFHHLPYVTFDYRVRPGSLLAKVANSKELQDELIRKIRTKHAELYRPISLEHWHELTQRLREHTIERDALRAEAAALSGELTELRERLAEREAEIAGIKGSWAWRVTTLGGHLARKPAPSPGETNPNPSA